MEVYVDVRWLMPMCLQNDDISLGSGTLNSKVDVGATLPTPNVDSEESSSSSSSVHGDNDLFCGKEISQDLENAPKEELFRLLRLKGHIPRLRNSRPGNIQVACKACDGRSSTSTYRRDAWYVTNVTHELGKQCRHATPSADETRSELSRMWSVVVYGGVWGCTSSIVTCL